MHFRVRWHIMRGGRTIRNISSREINTMAAIAASAMLTVVAATVEPKATEEALINPDMVIRQVGRLRKAW